MKKIILLFISNLIICCSLMSQQYGEADTRNPQTMIPLSVKPLIDHWLRDTWIMRGPDNNYYMTGTSATNDGLYMWKSKNLKEWESLGLIWSYEKDATWQKDLKVHESKNVASINSNNKKYRALWAPELHYLRSQNNWFIVTCISQDAVGGGSFILKSTTGKPEGPYVNIEGNKEKALFPRIDGSLFEDTDSTVYFIGHNHEIARMKPDMNGFAEKFRRFDEKKYNPEPYVEGASIFKIGGKYHLVQAIWTHRLPNGEETYVAQKNKDNAYSYDCIIASSDNIYGPYSERYTAITGGGHNSLFQDTEGNWWATTFFNVRGGQGKEFKYPCRPAIIPMKYENDRFSIDLERCK